MRPIAVAACLTHLVKAKRPPFIWGPPGVGKSDVVHQVGKALDMEVRDVRLSLLDPIDLKGFPVPDAEAGVMRWLPAEFLPQPSTGKGKTKSKPVLLFLDEMNTAPQSVQAAAYQLILNRRIGEYHLPDDCAIISAGNRAGDRSVTHAQPAALANRFVHIDFDVHPDDWDDWARQNGMHTDLRAFIKFRPNLLHAFDTAQNPRAFASPRSWSFVNDIYKSQLTRDEEFELIKGTVGEAATGEFLAFTQHLKDLPTVDEVMLNPDKAKLPQEPSGMWAIAVALQEKADASNFGRIMKYIKRMQPEFQVVFVKGAVRACEDLTSSKDFMDWGLKNQDIIL